MAVDETILSVQLVLGVLTPCSNITPVGNGSLGFGTTEGRVSGPGVTVTVKIVVTNMEVLRPFVKETHL